MSSVNKFLKLIFKTRESPKISQITTGLSVIYIVSEEENIAENQ